MLNKILNVTTKMVKTIPTPVRRAALGVTGTVAAAAVYGTGHTKALAKEYVMAPVEATNKIVKVAAKPVIELAEDVFESTTK